MHIAQKAVVPQRPLINAVGDLSQMPQHDLLFPNGDRMPLQLLPACSAFRNSRCHGVIRNRENRFLIDYPNFCARVLNCCAASSSAKSQIALMQLSSRTSSSCMERVLSSGVIGSLFWK